MVRNVRTAGLVTLMLATALVGCDQLPLQPANAPADPASAEVPAAAAATPATPLILTAQGWGPLGIGMTKGRVIEALGAAAATAAIPVVPATATDGAPTTAAAPPVAAPPVAAAPEAGICEQFRPERAPAGTLVMIENGSLSRISLIEGSTLKTERGFGVGSTAAEIKAAYGGAVVSQPHKYEPAPAEDLYVWANGGSTAVVQDPDARGIRYEVGTDGKVRAVHAGGPSIQLAEGCS